MSKGELITRIIIFIGLLPIVILWIFSMIMKDMFRYLDEKFEYIINFVSDQISIFFKN